MHYLSFISTIKKCSNLKKLSQRRKLKVLLDLRKGLQVISSIDKGIILTN